LTRSAPGLDVNAIRAAVHDQVAALPERDRALALATLERVADPNWTLEWHLPWWLGEAFGVPSPIAARAVLSNVLGLVAVRLHDDAADGELDGHSEAHAGPSPAAAQRVAEALLGTAIDVYRPLFPPDSIFWRDLGRFLDAWRAADARRDGRSSLAARGAPLKAGARAMTLLGDRPAAWPLVERCLDAALTALALSDDASDWEGDLEAGRWNAFVAGLGVVSQRPRDRSRNRSRVLLALLDGDGAPAAYATIEAEARRAADLAAAFGCRPLADHLATVASRARADGAAVGAHYAAAADRMTRLLFEPTVTGGSRA
jgi:hypothetical protein